jgi:hypothetical protein
MMKSGSKFFTEVTMSVYTVHEPQTGAGESVNPDRYVFVRDGFHVWAFLLGPLWMVWRGLWLVLLGYLVMLAALGVGLYAARVPDGAVAAIGFLIALLIGFEASTLRRWTLRRNGFSEVAAVVGDDVESAERRFFSTWNGGTAKRGASSPAPAFPLMPRGTAAGVVGLFPEPGNPR